MAWAILDTDVYIAYWERGLFEREMSLVEGAFVVRHSAVVLFELRRGARSEAARRLVERLFRIAAVRWEPTVADWWEAGRLVREIGDREHWDTRKRRDFQNDSLIALTARRHGATVVTANRADFTLLASALRISLLVPPTQRAGK